jgi:hypothetical protein
MIEDDLAIGDSPLSDSVLGYFKKVPIVQTVQVVQTPTSVLPRVAGEDLKEGI